MRLEEFIARRLGKHVDDIRDLRRCCRYKHKQIPKKRPGSARQVSIPREELLDVQYSILKWLAGGEIEDGERTTALCRPPRVELHVAAHGFVPGRSIITNATVHLHSWVVITMDLEAWYDYCSSEKIRRALDKQGLDRIDINLIVDLCTEKGHLPTGAPTSPILANVVACWLDERLEREAAAWRGWRYTRFADDLTFSSVVEWRGHELKERVERATNVIHSCGFRVAAKKTKIRKLWQRQEVTGVIVNPMPGDALCAHPRVPKEFKRIIRAVKHNLSKGRETKWAEEQLRSAEAFVQMVEAPQVSSSRRASW